jgi:hypothetical protein
MGGSGVHIDPPGPRPDSSRGSHRSTFERIMLSAFPPSCTSWLKGPLDPRLSARHPRCARLSGSGTARWRPSACPRPGAERSKHAAKIGQQSAGSGQQANTLSAESSRQQQAARTTQRAASKQVGSKQQTGSVQHAAVLWGRVLFQTVGASVLDRCLAGWVSKRTGSVQKRFRVGGPGATEQNLHRVGPNRGPSSGL